jgi:outer membrane lipoprotein-sorting protein
MSKLRHSTLCIAILAALAAVYIPSVASSAQDAATAWDVLDSARKSLAASGAERAAFVQTYVPAGFSTGEEESGRIAFRLPDCLRWDYSDPYPKSFLLCGEQVYSWNPDDRRGQTAPIDRRSQPGLDLLLLPVNQLSGRYDASSEKRSDGRVAVHLSPRAGMAGRTELTDATLVVDTRRDRLVEVSYQDREGNRTTFRISGYESLGDRSVFEPPKGISWTEG